MSYEFDDAQNKVIDGLASKMGTVGFFLSLAGLAVLFAGLAGLLPTLAPVPELPGQVPPEVGKAMSQWAEQVKAQDQTRVYYGALAGLIQAMILLAAAMYTRRSAKNFQKVVQTAGNDISHLMQALTALRNVFSLASTLLVLAVLLALGAAGISLYYRYMA